MLRRLQAGTEASERITDRCRRVAVHRGTRVHDDGILAPGEWTQIVPPGQAAPFLATLSVEHLPVSAEIQRRLQLLGLHTLGDLAALPAGAVAAQFGREGVRAWALAAGRDAEPLVPVVPTETPTERLDLPAPTADRAALDHVAALLLRRLFRQQAVGNQLVRRLTITLTLEDGRTWERAHTFRTPTVDIPTALFAVRTRLDALELPAAVVTVTLRLHDLCGERGQQARLFSTNARQQAAVNEAVRQVRARIGGVPLLRVVPLEPWSRLPERRFALAEYSA